MTLNNPSHQPVLQRLRRGLGAQGFGQAVNLFVRLAEVPLFLAFWGAERYGEWLMVAAVPSYLAMADGGFTGTTQREMTMRMGAGDRPGALAAFQSTWVLLLILSAVLLGLTFLAVTLLPFDHWLKLNSMQGNTLSIVILLLVAHIILGFQCGLVYGGYSCEGRYARGTYLWVLMLFLDFAGLMLAVMLGGSPIMAAIGFVIGRAIGLIIFLIDLPRVAPWLRFGYTHATKMHIARLFRPSLASMAFPLGDALNTQGMRLVVGLVLGPVAVTVFSTIRTLCRSAMKPTVIINRLIEPELALAHGAGNRLLIESLFLRSSQTALWVVLPISVFIWPLGEHIIQVWGRGKIDFDSMTYSWLLLASVINSIWYTAIVVPYAANRHERLAIWYAIANIAMIAIAYPLMYFYGVVGAGLAIVFAEIAIAWTVLHFALFMCDIRFLKWIKAVIEPPRIFRRFLKMKVD